MKTLRSHYLRLLITWCCVAVISQAGAQTAVPAFIAERVAGASLIGQGTLRWFGLHVYDARLFAAQPAFRAEAFSQTPFALELRYGRALQGGLIAERSDREIKQLDLGNEQQRAAWLTQMRALFPDVVAGDTLTGIHRPDRGAEFFLNGKSIGQVADPAFANAFFAIWLDPRTSEPKLRAALLGEPAR